MKIIYTNESGGISVVHPNEKAIKEIGIDAIAAKVVPPGVDFDIVDASVIPSDREFRNAWAFDRATKRIGHDMPKAREIAHAKRRDRRAAEFAPLDVEATIPSMAQQAEAKRQAIRNKYATMQTQIDAATTAEELKAIITQL